MFWLTVSVKLCVASGPAPLAAVMVSGYVPLVPGAGVPRSAAVPLLLLVNVTPDGSTPVAVIVAAGTPLARIMKVAAVPIVKVVPLALVMEGAELEPGGIACP